MAVIAQTFVGTAFLSKKEGDYLETHKLITSKILLEDSGKNYSRYMEDYIRQISESAIVTNRIASKGLRSISGNDWFFPKATAYQPTISQIGVSQDSKDLIDQLGLNYVVAEQTAQDFLSLGFQNQVESSIYTNNKDRYLRNDSLLKYVKKISGLPENHKYNGTSDILKDFFVVAETTTPRVSKDQLAESFLQTEKQGQPDLYDKQAVAEEVVDLRVGNFTFAAGESRLVVLQFYGSEEYPPFRNVYNGQYITRYEHPKTVMTSDNFWARSVENMTTARKNVLAAKFIEALNVKPIIRTGYVAEYSNYKNGVLKDIRSITEAEFQTYQSRLSNPRGTNTIYVSNGSVVSEGTANATAGTILKISAYFGELTAKEEALAKVRSRDFAFEGNYFSETGLHYSSNAVKDTHLYDSSYAPKYLSVTLVHRITDKVMTLVYDLETIRVQRHRESIYRHIESLVQLQFIESVNLYNNNIITLSVLANHHASFRTHVINSSTFKSFLVSQGLSSSAANSFIRKLELIDYRKVTALVNKVQGEISQIKDYQFFPLIPVIVDKTNILSNTIRPEVKEAVSNYYKKITGSDFTQVVESLTDKENNPDVAKLYDMYLEHAVPINTPSSSGIRYIKEFCKHFWEINHGTNYSRFNGSVKENRFESGYVSGLQYFKGDIKQYRKVRKVYVGDPDRVYQEVVHVVSYVDYTVGDEYFKDYLPTEEYNKQAKDDPIFDASRNVAVAGRLPKQLRIVRTQNSDNTLSASKKHLLVDDEIGISVIERYVISRQTFEDIYKNRSKISQRYDDPLFAQRINRSIGNAYEKEFGVNIAAERHTTANIYTEVTKGRCIAVRGKGYAIGSAPRVEYIRGNDAFGDSTKFHPEKTVLTASDSSIVFMDQQTDGSVEIVIVWGLYKSYNAKNFYGAQINNNIGWLELYNPETSSCTFPLHHDVLKKLSNRDKNNVTNENMLVTWLGSSTHEWKSGGFFKKFFGLILVVLVAVVAAFVPAIATLIPNFLGAHSAIGAGALGAGAAATTALSFGVLINGFAALVLGQIIGTIANDVGGILGKVIGAVINIVLTKGVAGISGMFKNLSNWTSFANVSNLLNVTEAVLEHKLNAAADELDDLASEVGELSQKYKDTLEDIEERSQQFGESGLTQLIQKNILNRDSDDTVILPESPEEFRLRTSLRSEDIIQLTYNMVYNFQELANELEV